VSAPPSINLALMAWKLAQIRIFSCYLSLLRPVTRDMVEEGTPGSVEYYHILRRIEDGETP
jgi:hypothetical protein